MTIILGRIGIGLAGIATVKISTTLLSPDQLGSISQLNSLVNLFNITLIIPVAHYMTRGFLDWYDSGKLLDNTRKYFKYVLLIVALSVLLSGFIQWQWSLVKGFGIAAVMLLVGMNIFAQPVNAFGATGYNLFGLRKINVFFTNLVAWSALGFSLSLFYFYRDNFSWSLGQALGFVAGGTSILFLWKKIKKKNGLNIAEHVHAIPFSKSAIFAFSWPFVFTSSLWWIQTQSYRFVLERIQDISQVGLFATAYALAAMPIMLYESIIGQFLEPTYFGELKNQGREGQVKAWNKYAALYLPGMAIMGAYVAVSTPFMSTLFLGEQYRAVAIKVTVWAAVIETMRAAGAMMFQLGMAKVDNRMTIAPVLAGAILAPLGVYFLGKIDPVYGTIAGLLFAGLVALMINVWLSYKVLPINWPVKRILYGLALTLPVIIGLNIVYSYFPNPGFITSLLSLAVSGVYIGGILLLVLGGKGKKFV